MELSSLVAWLIETVEVVPVTVKVRVWVVSPTWMDTGCVPESIVGIFALTVNFPLVSVY